MAAVAASRTMNLSGAMDSAPAPAPALVLSSLAAVAAAVAGLLASLSAQPPPPVHLHTIGVTAIAQFSSNFLIPQLVDAIERSASSHLTLAPSSFAKTFNTHCLPGISENPSLAASAVVDARKRNHLTDAKFVMTDPSLPKVNAVSVPVLQHTSLFSHSFFYRPAA